MLFPGPPAQTVSSLSCNCSRAGFPNTIAAIRPLPTGRASFQLVAGCLYQSLFCVFPKNWSILVIGDTCEDAWVNENKADNSKRNGALDRSIMLVGFGVL